VVGRKPRRVFSRAREQARSAKPNRKNKGRKGSRTPNPEEGYVHQKVCPYGEKSKKFKWTGDAKTNRNSDGHIQMEGGKYSNKERAW